MRLVDPVVEPLAEVQHAEEREKEDGRDERELDECDAAL
jgi:hypothetical protein